MSERPSILVVDDEQVVLDSVRKLLKREDYEIRTALSGAAALAALREQTADVIITDLMMPGMDGLELMERILESGHLHPVIMITGYATMRTALQALRKGAFDYIAKPFTRTELQGVVARAVRQAGLGLPAAPTRPVGPEEFHHLGGHCWVLVRPDGSATVGLERTFAETVGDVDEVELPDVGDYMEQGSVCLRILTKDGRSHTLWSPLSGSVLEVNTVVRDDPGLCVREPYAAGWLLRLDPGNLAEELKSLSLE